MKTENKRYKMYLVEVDDVEREAVLEADIENLVLQSEPTYSEIYSDAIIDPVRYVQEDNITLQARVLGSFTIRNFKKEYEDERS